MSKGSATQIFGIGGRDGFAQLVAGHPLDPHGFSRLLDTGKVADDVHKLAGLRWSAHLAYRRDMSRMRRRGNRKRAFKESMAVGLQTEHRAAKFNRVDQRSAYHIFYNPWHAGGAQALADRADKLRVVIVSNALAKCMGLAGWRGPNEIEAVKRIGQRVRLMKLERVVRLRINIDADHIKTGPVQAHPGTASTAKQIKRARPHRLFSFVSHLDQHKKYHVPFFRWFLGRLRELVYSC